MNNEQNELVSALMDGHLDESSADLVKSINNDASLKATWWRYHVISDALRAEKTVIMHKSLSERISAEIADEPVVLAPGALKSESKGLSWQKSVAGLAIAASVAMLAILGVQQGNNDVDTGASVVPTVADTTTYSPPGPISTLPPQYVNGQRIISPVVTNPASNSRMNSYMVNYNEFRTTGSKMQGMLPYVRIIANDVEEK
jgi:sigma-E factor negative regulatory protein RseA